MIYTVQPVVRVLRVTGLVTLLNDPKKKGFYFEGESHDFWEGVFVYEGSATVTSDNKISHLEKGMFFLHKPMEFHRCWAPPDVAPKLLTLSFRAKGEALDNLDKFCFCLSEEQQEFLWKIVELFQKIKDDTSLHNNYRHQRDRTLLAAMLEVFLIQLTENDIHDDNLSHNEACYSHILQTMKEHCNQSLTVPELADLCNMSLSNMKRIFGLYSDLSIGKAFLQIRIRQAMDMMDCGIPARDVAKALDFSEISYFYTVFKRETGLTPTQYIKRKSEDVLVI